MELVAPGPSSGGTRRLRAPVPWNSPPRGPSSVELVVPARAYQGPTRAQFRGTRRIRSMTVGRDGYLLWATIGNRPSSPIKACRDFGIKLAERSVPCIYVNTERLLRGDFLISCWRGQEMHPGGRTGGLAKLGHPSLYFLRHGDARPASSAFQLFKPFSRRGGLSML